jgi:hypothetical protein
VLLATVSTVYAQSKTLSTDGSIYLNVCDLTVAEEEVKVDMIPIYPNTLIAICDCVMNVGILLIHILNNLNYF